VSARLRRPWYIRVQCQWCLEIPNQAGSRQPGSKPANRKHINETPESLSSRCDITVRGGPRSDSHHWRTFLVLRGKQWVRPMVPKPKSAQSPLVFREQRTAKIGKKTIPRLLRNTRLVSRKSEKSRTAIRGERDCAKSGRIRLSLSRENREVRTE
jgi:hypothetical protein